MHGKATMAEASYWMLSKQEVYREPQTKRHVLSSMHGKARPPHGPRGRFVNAKPDCGMRDHAEG
jgi:hypothetical protein